MANNEFSRERLIVPAVAPIYNSTHELVETILRVVAGVLLVTHGFGKITNPFGAVGMVESLGFYPGVFWSPLLAATEFFGGILVAIGLLTRPAAFAAFIVLIVTVYFHWIVRSEGLVGAEKSVLWSAVFLFFAVRGGNRHSVDAKLRKVF
ncbi:putative oxidoreductase [Agrobacterium larrymoorei]|uniref:Oxidoreductase n=1 Tax=Agrobacterium larrymoorei TaxID=160699 RepID=A0AAJ2BE52_9HYPH|nr:DoxX family protein [Agrobacterium larrymoorei]MDR6103844.1 putative oxidoreductase [Agrobacterium larrymoorei]